MGYFLTLLRWLVALVLCAWGVFMATGFIAEKFSGGSKQPVWFDLLFFALVGLAPLVGGMMLIFFPRLRSKPTAK